MDVQVKLSLRGGHVWQFLCNEDDPVVLGLVSALPGAEAGSNLPPDGLIQVEAQSGERLFLTRSSLISVEIRPIGAAGADGARRSQAPPPVLSEGCTSPAPFALLPQALPAEIHKVLVEDAAAQAGASNQGKPGENRELDATRTSAAVKGLASSIAAVRAALGVPDQLETHFDAKMFAIADRGSVAFDSRGGDALRFLYVFHAQPKRFSGGGVRLFDGVVEKRLRRTARTFRDVIVEDNSLLVFPGDVLGTGLPVDLSTRVSAEGMFVLVGALRRGSA